MNSVESIKIQRKVLQIRKDLEESIERFNVGLEIVETDLYASYPEIHKETILMHAFQAGYSSIENAIKRIAELTNEGLPNNDQWHREHIEQAGMDLGVIRPPIISEEMERRLNDLRGFRHVAIHSYSKFDFQSSMPAQHSARFVVDNIQSEFDIFLEKMGFESNPESNTSIEKNQSKTPWHKKNKF